MSIAYLITGYIRDTFPSAHITRDGEILTVRRDHYTTHNYSGNIHVICENGCVRANRTIIDRTTPPSNKISSRRLDWRSYELADPHMLDKLVHFIRETLDDQQ